VIRIYDLSGRVLYEAWHDGEITNIMWLPIPRLMVFTGRNRSHDWDERLPRDDPHRRNLIDVGPRVMFALRPRLDAKPAWLDADADQWNPYLVYYKCVLPPYEAERFTLRLLMPAQPLMRSRSIEFYLYNARADAGVSWLIDATGRILPDSRTIVDGYHRDPEAPDPDILSLADLPPAISPPFEQGDTHGGSPRGGH